MSKPKEIWSATFNDFDEFWEFEFDEISFGCFTGWQDEHADNQAVVDRIIKAVNCHDELLAALKEMLSIDDWHNEEIAPSKVIKRARAAIDKAEAQ